MTMGRRAFLARAAHVAWVAAALERATGPVHADASGAPGAAGPAAGGGAGQRVAQRGSMFLSLNGSLMPQPVEWLEFARLAARVGYGGADVNLGAAQKQGAEATRALLAELKIRPGILSLPVRFGGEEAQFQEGLAQLPAAAAFAAAIGCPRMMAVMPPASATPMAEYRPLIRDRMLKIADVLQKSQVRLGLEFLGPSHFRTRLIESRPPHEFIWRMGDLLAFVETCGPAIGITLDAWHWHHAGATAADIVAAGTSRIVHVHVSDAKAQPPDEVRDNQRLMPGEGVIDLVTFFRTLQQIGYTDAVSPEPIGRVPADMSAEAGARLGLDTTRTVLTKAGLTV